MATKDSQSILVDKFLKTHIADYKDLNNRWVIANERAELFRHEAVRREVDLIKALQTIKRFDEHFKVHKTLDVESYKTLRIGG